MIARASNSKRLGAAGAGGAAKCATRAKKKSGKARKVKDDGVGGAQKRGLSARHSDGLDP
jgi:hypothetical protein